MDTSPNNASNRLFVGSLPWETTSEDLETLFSRFGSVVDVVVIKDKQSGKSKGFGFVEMATREEAEAAAKFNGYEFKNRALVVNIAAPKAPRSLFQS
jgi:RNA recognition motif-containing protein